MLFYRFYLFICISLFLLIQNGLYIYIFSLCSFGVCTSHKVFFLSLVKTNNSLSKWSFTRLGSGLGQLRIIGGYLGKDLVLQKLIFCVLFLVNMTQKKTRAATFIFYPFFFFYLFIFLYLCWFKSGAIYIFSVCSFGVCTSHEVFFLSLVKINNGLSKWSYTKLGGGLGQLRIIWGFPKN